MFRVIKESENVDERQHCFLIQSFGKQSHYFSVETRQVRPCRNINQPTINIVSCP